MKKLIVVADPRSWRLQVPGVDVVASRDYLTDPAFSGLRNARVFNLSRSYGYQSRGYYVSLLAEARGQKVIPSVRAILDMRASSVVQVLSRDLSGLIQSTLSAVEEDHFTLTVYFGRNVEERYDKLARELYKVFQAPLLRVRFARSEAWELRNVRTIPYQEIPQEHHEDLETFATEYFARRRHERARPSTGRYDLAILVNPQDDNAPSDRRAIARFRRAARELGFDVDLISPADLDRVGEYDALFIRENTTVDHHTYRFASRAEANGVAVIDSPEAILKCNNKVYLAEALTGAGVPTPRTLIVHSDNRATVAETLGLPVVLKLPDSTFSRGVTKATTDREVKETLDGLFEESDLVIAQEFIPTAFDWRIGVLDGAPLYACKYFMARDHWQIYNWGTKRAADLEGDWATVPVEEAPAAVVDAAVRAVKAVGVAGLFGVDVKDRDGAAFVIEVNECPNVDAGVEDGVLGDALYRTIIRSLLRSVERRTDVER